MNILSDCFYNQATINFFKRDYIKRKKKIESLENELIKERYEYELKNYIINYKKK